MTDFLATVSESDRKALAARWTTRRYQRDETVLSHEEYGRDVFFVLEGRASATIYSATGRAVAYRDIEAGDIFGELSAIDGQARSASVIALTEMTAARLSEAAFQDVVNSCPTFTWALLKHLSMQMRRMTDRIQEFSTLAVRQRLIRELLRLAGDNGTTDQLEIEEAPTHVELAAKISTHREAVSREMSALAKAGFLAKRHGSLSLRMVRGLRELAAEK